MANIRTLKLNLLADTTDFAKGIKKASGQTNSFAKDVAHNMKIASVAAAGMALAFGVSAVKAAAADQKSQKQLALALKNTTKATNAQVVASEKWITAQQFAYGVADDKLRPALAKLVRVTGDVKKSQNLLSLALDVSAGSGKDLETVTNAISRAQQGNLTGLKRLGVPLSDTIIKNKDLAAALKITEDRFKGAAAQGADTLSGKMAIFNQRMSEAKETIGTAIITAIQPLADKWLPKISSGVTNFVAGLTGANGMNQAVKDGQDNVFILGQNVASFFKTLNDNKGLLRNIGILIGSIFIGAKAGAAVGAMVSALATLRAAFLVTTGVAATTAAAEAAATGGASLLLAAPAIGAIIAAFGAVGLIGLLSFDKNKGKGKPTGAAAGAVRSGAAQQDTGVGAGGFGGLSSGDPVTNSGGNGWGGGARGITKRSNFRQSSTTIINLNGIVDGESARRSIERVMQESSIRTGAINLNGAAL
jgi:hypothetical protein